MAHLFDALAADYALNGRRSATSSAGDWRTRGPPSEPLRAVDVTPARIRRYKGDHRAAAREGRIRSTRCFGVYSPGVDPVRAASRTGCAHSEQNFAAGGSCVPQLSQREANGAAHS